MAMIAPLNQHFGSARVYRIADPGPLVSNSAAIAEVLFGKEASGGGKHTFTIHPASGYLFYTNSGELWQNPKGAQLPTDKREVEKIGRHFFEEANRRVAGSGVLQKAKVGPLFPQDLRPMRIGRVVAKGSAMADHWLCEFGVYLAVDGERAARVEGATVAVRIGRRGKVVGLSARWRPVSGELLSAEGVDPTTRKADYAAAPGSIRPPQTPSVEPISKPVQPKPGPGGDNEEGSPEYLFWLADENAPQTALAPFLLEHADHGGRLEAASKHSLWVEILQRAADGRMEFLAVPQGGTGDYTYRWACWTLESVFTRGLQEIGSSGTVQAPSGISNVVVQVRDKLTGAVAQRELSGYPAG